MPRTLQLGEAQRILGVEEFGCTSLHCPSNQRSRHKIRVRATQVLPARDMKLLGLLVKLF